MSEAIINQINLEYLINKVYHKLISKQKLEPINSKDKKFYRKRIFNLTKELLLTKEIPENLPGDVKYAFDNYIKSCIHYFKIIDSNDIIQEDYKNLTEIDILNTLDTLDTLDQINEDKIKLQQEVDKLLMRTIKTNHSLDNFVKLKMIKTPNEPFIPKQKEINLQDPTLRNKGILNSIKKENIINKYEDQQNTTQNT